jgi:hypothetical protein
MTRQPAKRAQCRGTLALLFVALLMPGRAVAQTEVTFSIADSLTARSIAGALVELTTLQGRRVWSGRSGSDGRASVRVEPGQIILTAHMLAYELAGPVGLEQQHARQRRVSRGEVEMVGEAAMRRGDSEGARRMLGHVLSFTTDSFIPTSPFDLPSPLLTRSFGGKLDAAEVSFGPRC